MNTKFIRKRFSFNVVLILVAISMLRCARILHPEGGPKDLLGPVMISSSIEDGSTNCDRKMKQIIFEYNKEIKIKNIRAVIITPLLDNEEEQFYEVDVWKNQLYINFKKELAENTTYVIELSGAISDTNEYTEAENYSMAFSTGSNIDTKKIFCKVVDKKSNLPLDKIQILLYELEDGEIQPKNYQKPSYIGLSNTKGEFSFKNVREGKFFVCAVEGGYRKLVGLNEIKAGFCGDVIDTSVNSEQNCTIYVNSSDHKPIEILSKQAFSNVFVIHLSKEVADFNIDSANGNLDLPIFYKSSYDNKKIYIWSNDNLFEDELNLTVKDFANNVLKEQIAFKLDSSKSSNIESKFYVVAENGRDELPTEGRIEIFSEKFLNADYFEYGLIKININEKDIYFGPENFEISKDKVTLYYSIDKSMFSDSNSGLEGYVIIGKNAILDIDGIYNKEEILRFKFRNPQSSACLSGTISAENWFEVRLANLKGEDLYVFKQNTLDDERFIFNDINPGKYIIKIFRSSDLNGKWKTGNFYKGEPSDDIIIYPKEIELYANWKIENILIEG